MINPVVEKALNDQINAELYSAYLYLSMAAALENMGLPGFASWMRVQNQEETSHTMKIFDFIIERGGKVQLAAIDAPPSNWKDVLTVFQETLKHEQLVTILVNNLMDTAIEQKDHATNMFLQWFVTEQVEEEANVDEVLQQLELAQESKGALFMLDKDMGTRVFTPPSAEGGA
ncbi:MAG: ferritin [Planctomycetes bacterium]|nr:ferritin [Planctomycetota bacterium]